MNKKILRFLTVIFSACLMLLIFNNKSNASSMSVSVSKYTVSPGESFTVTVSVSNGAGSVSVSASNGILSSSSAWLDNSSANFTCTAGSSGSVKVSATGNFADYSTGEDEQPKYGSATVTIQASSSSSSSSGGSSTSSGNSSSSGSSSSNKKTNTSTNTSTVKEEEKSNNATLAELVVDLEGVTIIPEFAKDTLEYKVDVPNEITELNITATPEDSKASVLVTGNTEFQVGENAITVEVTAEDGTKQVYTIKVTRAREKLALKTIVIKYEDENGNLVELPLNPSFISNIYEYSLEDISYKIANLLVECEANLEGAIIEIKGNDNLVAGENIITITITLPAEPNIEGEEETTLEDEVITYTIKFNKEQTPTFWQKVKNKINGILGIVRNWYNNNQKPIIIGSLTLCIVAMIGLSVYIIIDAKKYKMLVQKFNKLYNMNNLESKQIEDVASNNIVEDIAKENNIEVKEDEGNNKKGGRHF